MSDRFELQRTPLDGVVVVERRPRRDGRGSFERIFCSDELTSILGSRRVVQVNRSVTSLGGTTRGMHYQLAPNAELKIVSCLRGSIFDVAIDLRRGSPTFLRWHGEVLSGDNDRSLAIPEGFAHGFQALADDTEVLYLTTAPYDAQLERGLNPLDPALAIGWPLPVERLSDRDAARPYLDGGFEGVSV